MKKVIGILALLALVGNIANAELLKNFKFDGQIDVHAYSYNDRDFNEDAQDETSNTDTRVMINAGFDLNDDVSAVVSAVKLNREYGNASENSVNTALDAFKFEQAYMHLKGVFGLDHKLGRQYYGEAGDLIVYYGPGTWPYTRFIGPNVAAIDGWTGWYENGDWKVHAIMAKETNGATTNPSTDVNVSGVKAMTKFMGFDLAGYVYQQVDKNTAAKKDYLDVVGVKGKYAVPAIENLTVAAEYAMNMGSNFNKPAIGYEHQGFVYKLNADFSMDIMGKLAFMGEYLFWSGDESNNKKDTLFKDINSDYRPGILFGNGFSTLAGGSGYKVATLGAKWNPEAMEKLTLGANYVNASVDKKVALADKHLGNELDLCANWMHSENVNIKAYYAMLSPEKDNNANDDAQTMMGAAFMVKF